MKNTRTSRARHHVHDAYGVLVQPPAQRGRVVHQHHGGVHRQDQGRLDHRAGQDPAQKHPQALPRPDRGHQHRHQEQPHEALDVRQQHVHAVFRPDAPPGAEGQPGHEGQGQPDGGLFQVCAQMPEKLRQGQNSGQAPQQNADADRSSLPIAAAAGDAALQQEQAQDSEGELAAPLGKGTPPELLRYVKDSILQKIHHQRICPIRRFRPYFHRPRRR